MAEREECTGIAAQWCPNCGTCNCPEDPRGGRTRDRATCPLHGPESRHAETLCAGGCGEIVSAPGDRCDPCEVKHLRAELDALRAITEGRTTPPTDAEMEAHEAAGGHFRWQARETAVSLAISPTGCSGWRETPGDAWGDVWERSHVDERRPPPDARWWARDANGAPCAWPVATEAPRG